MTKVWNLGLSPSEFCSVLHVWPQSSHLTSKPQVSKPLSADKVPPLLSLRTTTKKFGELLTLQDLLTFVQEMIQQIHMVVV